MTFQTDKAEYDADADADDEYSPFISSTKTKESYSFSKSFLNMAFNWM